MGYYIPDHAFCREIERIGFRLDLDILLDIFNNKISRDTYQSVSVDALRYAAYELFAHMEDDSLGYMNPTIMSELEDIDFSRFNRRDQNCYEYIYQNFDFGEKYEVIVYLINSKQMGAISNRGGTCFPNEPNYNEFSIGYCGYHKDEDDGFYDEDYDDYDYDNDEDYDDDFYN